MIQAKCYKDSDPNIMCLKHDLKVGEMYEVERIDMGNSHTDVFLKRCARKPYNSVLFQFFEDGKEINIYQDKRFNKYLK